MHRKGTGSNLVGVILIIIGLYWMAREFGFGYMFYPGLREWVLLIVGVLFLVAGYIQNRRGLVFTGAVLGFIGVLRLAVGFRMIDIFLEVWPLYIMIAGLAFFALIPLKPRDYAAAFPGIILIGTGILLFIEANDYLRFSHWYRPGSYWPVILIFIGAMMLWRSMRERRQKPQSGSMPDDPTDI